MTSDLNRREFLKTALGAGAFVASGTLPLTAAGAAQSIPKRVVVVTIDTLRADHLGCYGYPGRQGPFLSTLAKNSYLFEHAFAPTHQTSPAHVSLFSGLQLAQHKIFSNLQHRLPKAIFTMAEMFKELEYDTASFCSVQFVQKILDRGFNTSVSFSPPTDPDFKYQRGEVTIDKALTWLQEKGPEENLFLWIHLYDPHSPLGPPQEFVDRLKPRNARNEGELLNYWLNRQHKELQIYPFKYDIRNFIDTNLDYDAEIAYSEHHLKRLYDAFESKGLNEDSLWVITSDHGQGLGTHASFGHTEYIYQEILHVPLLFHFPSEDIGAQTIPAVVELVDIFPTLAEMLGVSLSNQAVPISGESLSPLMSGTAERRTRHYALAQRIAKHPRAKHTESWEDGPVYCIQDETWKYLYHTHGDDELFNVALDPYEQVNQISGATDIAHRMKAEAEVIYEDLVQSAASVVIPDLPDENLEELEALGYLG